MSRRDGVLAGIVWVALLFAVSPARGQGDGSSANGARARVAVLPFVNITGAPADDWISAGIAETLSVDLQRDLTFDIIGSEQVSEAMRAAGGSDAPVDPSRLAELGRGLGVRWVMSGGFQRVGDRLRITAQLVDVVTRTIARAPKIDGTLNELFALQDRLAALLQGGVAPEVRAEPALAEGPEPFGRESATPGASSPPIRETATSGVSGFAAPPTAAIHAPPHRRPRRPLRATPLDGRRCGRCPWQSRWYSMESSTNRRTKPPRRSGPLRLRSWGRVRQWRRTRGRRVPGSRRALRRRRCADHLLQSADWPGIGAHGADSGRWSTDRQSRRLHRWGAEYPDRRRTGRERRRDQFHHLAREAGHPAPELGGCDLHGAIGVDRGRRVERNVWRRRRVLVLRQRQLQWLLRPHAHARSRRRGRKLPGGVHLQRRPVCAGGRPPPGRGPLQPGDGLPAARQFPAHVRPGSVQPAASRDCRGAPVHVGGQSDYIESVAGQVESRIQQASFQTEFENSDRFSADVQRSYEFLAVPFTIASDVTIPVGGYAFQDYYVSYSMGAQRRLSGTLSLQRGEFFDGDITAVGYSRGRIEVTRQFSFEPSVSINRIELSVGRFTAKLATTRLTYTFTPRLFFSGLLQYNSTQDVLSTNLRLRWEYRSGSELFVVYNDQRDTELGRGRFPLLENRAFVVKFTRLFRY